MKYIKADLKRPILLGRQGENGVTTVQFPVRVFFPDMEEATYTLVHSREGDNVPYFCATVLNEDMLEWLILKADVDKPGAGVLQLTASSEEDKIGKSIILTTQTESSLGEAGDAPEAMESWLANMEALAVRAERGAADAATSQAAADGSATAAAESAEAAREYEVAAETAVSHYPKIENDTWWVWDPVTGAYVDTGVSAEGYVGEDGYSPAVTISTITGGHNVNITDKTHPAGQDFNVMDGATGPQGPTGIEVSSTQPTNPNIDVWFQEQQQGTPVEVYTVPEINDMIAPAETSPTQAAHHVGEYIICVLNGQAKLYKVIAEISIDETLNPGQGGNIQAVSVGNMMTPVVAQLERGSVYSSIVKTPYTWKVFKIGAICFVSITFDTFSIPAVIGWKEIYTLPYTVSQDLGAVSSYIVTKKGKSTQIGLYQNVVRINNPETAIEEGDTISVVLPYITSDY